MAIDPAKSEAQYQLAVKLRNRIKESTLFAMANSGKYRRAIEAALELNPDNYPAWQEKIGFLMFSPSFAGGSMQKAMEVAEELKARNEEQGLIAWGRIFDEKKDYTKQLLVYENLVAKYPAASHRFKVGRTLQQLQRYKDAAVIFDTNVAEAADEDQSLYQAARSRILGNFELEVAAQLLQRFIAAYKDNPGDKLLTGAWWRLGNVQESLGNKDEARNAYQKALALDPKFDRAAKDLRNLK